MLCCLAAGAVCRHVSCTPRHEQQDRQAHQGTGGTTNHHQGAANIIAPLFSPASRRILDRGARLELLHKTQLEGIPGALVAFKGRLLAGVGPVLRLFELGRKKLLRKCEYRQLPQHVAALHTLGSRIYVGDVQVARQGKEQQRQQHLSCIRTLLVVARWCALLHDWCDCQVLS